MKRIYIVLFVLISTFSFAQEDRTSFVISGGTQYLDNFFVDFGFSIIKPLAGNKELDIKVSLDLRTENDGESVKPEFNIPVYFDINFLFPIGEKLTYLVGTGITPTLRPLGDESIFLIGPNAKMGFRYKIHPSMSLLLEATQSLLIGPPNWMYSATQIIFGINFFI